MICPLRYMLSKWNYQHRAEQNKKFTPDLPNVFCFFFLVNLSDCTWMSTKWQINAYIIVIIFSQPIICLNSPCTTLKLFDILFDIHQPGNQKRYQHGKTNSAKKFLWCIDCKIKTLYVRHVDARLSQILIYIMLSFFSPFENNNSIKQDSCDTFFSVYFHSSPHDIASIAERRLQIFAITMIYFRFRMLSPYKVIDILYNVSMEIRAHRHCPFID